ncbi:MAG: 3-dehydroquinate synthase [Hyphomicrobiales bacterium]|nr:3-dehydroquinate synthase [Hyphomicrobiales bacterium]MCP5370667.1 3-dehydroquinate synthase [Hyphomicrobiales bacterium]
MNTLAPQPETLNVALGARAYDIHVGEDLIDGAGALMAPVLARPRVVVVSDANVAPLYLDRLGASLDRTGIAHDAVVLPAGEQTKDFDHLRDLTGRLLDLRVERSTTLVALGGGVIGDLTGFAAAITLRGLDFVQIPTTLLAQVDSSVGGKTGINVPQGKNLVGAFHQPRLVLADTTALDSLPPRELRAGYAEVVKYGVIGDRPFFDWLVENGEAVCGQGGNVRPARRHAVLTGCRAKAGVVAEDERESGRRALLNLGHTFGHALEAETGYGDRLLHGEAVAIGMVMAMDLSARLGLCPPGDADALRRHLDAVGLPTGLRGLADGSWTAERLMAHMALDKKVEGGRVTFILARGLGQAFVSRDVAPATVEQVLETFLDGA